MIRSKIVTAITIVMLTSLITLPMSYGQTIDEGRYRIKEEDGWRIVRTDVFTVAVPSTETSPMFIWWHNDDDSTLYVAKYEGLAEAWLFTSEQFSHSDLFDDMKGFKNEFMVRAHSHGWIENQEIVPKINEVSRSLHPFFFPFSQGKWELTPIQEIKAKDGTLVGLAFAFILTESTDPSFEFAEENIMIRNKIFFDPVKMQVGENEVVLSKAELKSDIITSNWKWNYDTFIGALEEPTDSLPEIAPKLVLSAKFNVRSVSEENLINIMNEERNDISGVSEQDSLEVMVRVRERIMVVGKIDKEDEISATNGLPKLEILAEGRTMVGFFKFDPRATIIYEDQGTTGSVEVKGVSWVSDELKTFLIYPYFGGNTLLHDPSIGISSPELESEVPKYIFNLPIGSREIVPPSQSIIPIEMVPFFELVMEAVIFVMIVATVIAFTKKMKIEVLNGV
ncbi:MAG: hypothetical protein H3Z51_05420 [archaeon]|nr:hypothetical protein [archaeon]